ncbi:omh3 [Symbiodinium natans]|uniref:Omh3 protein n=1 Tax=Symbiodinium natans TaxID=878477 RepID=A0A812VAE9_9DINO|nr:omh3 [Symbiodinium natans]
MLRMPTYRPQAGLVKIEARLQAIWWLAQCSLASASAIMEEQGYALLHLEHTFAVFVLKATWSAVSPLLRPVSAPASSIGSLGEVGSSGLRGVEPGAVTLYDHWLKGWHCSAAAPGLFGLETVRGAAELAALRNRSVPAEVQRESLCQFILAHRLPLVDWNDICTKAAAVLPQSWRSWELQDPLDEPGKAYVLQSSGRGRCLSHLGFCECFPPYRGRFCEHVEPGKKDSSRKYRAVLHYLVGDREKLLADFERTLPILWERFNNQEDYPVVVFHDGMSKASRKRILEASSNRIWFAYVEDFKSVPAVFKGRIELELGGYGLGYRGMCRFRSGPIFVQPVMKGFDYAWTLDTDGYFPADILSDPLERMWREDRVYGYSHVSRDQASAVQHFWEFCRLYFESKGIDPKATKMMRRLTDALVLRDTYWHEWNRVLFMNDIEITKLSWFQSPQYQDPTARLLLAVHAMAVINSKDFGFE